MAILAVSGGLTDLATIAPEFGFSSDIVGVLLGDNDIYTWEGNDSVYTTRAAVGSTQNVFLGYGNDAFYGGSGNDYLRDQSGNDVCSLGNGSDRIYVGSGNDVYSGGGGTDTVKFNFLIGDDGVQVPNTIGVTFDLAKTTAQNLGALGVDTFSGFENVDGGNGNDRLFGTASGNAMDGRGGNDVIDGRAGNDTLVGYDGADVLIGGLGKDSLDGSEGTILRDTFRFLTLADSAANTVACDSITFFDKGGLATDDRIDLSAIDARPLLAGNQTFVFRGTGAFTAAAGEVRLVVAGADTFVHIDTDTDAASEMIIKVTGVTGLKAADFIL